MTKSYVKIYGPPVAKAIRALEKIAVDMPEVSIYSSILAISPAIPFDPTQTQVYFDRSASVGPEISVGRKAKLISKHGATIGEYDFFFEWETKPNWEQVEDLINKIDKALKPLGCNYTITTK